MITRGFGLNDPAARCLGKFQEVHTPLPLLRPSILKFLIQVHIGLFASYFLNGNIT